MTANNRNRYENINVLNGQLTKPCLGNITRNPKREFCEKGK